ncbi:hypothetical protein CBS76997_10740 [Aspergillus niger]|nr:hypothetical protein CBS13152_10768 [Aspergillus niger]KAI2874985.1 hypothetical protein CBS11852_10607 [Aspergillus niger]KAI2952660.1 hypothetical protein CBS147323_10272 [Aspergillus niger]KAI3035110.1 hypothetical protein CBS76997_10740 [Aspergillus niger]
MRPSRPPLGIIDANYTLAPLYSSFPAALTSSSPSFPSLQDQDTSVSAYPSMGPGKYPRNVSFWHNPPAQPQPPLPPTAVATSYPLLKYYNIALKLLRKSLSSGELHNEATLITVLVLATFEESIGNWVNLMCTIRLHKH